MEDLFGNLIEDKGGLSRAQITEYLGDYLKTISLEDFVRLITNEFNEIIEYAELGNGLKTCQKTSLLFNPHRLNIDINGNGSLYGGLQSDAFISGLARALIFKIGKVNELLYQVLQLGINGRSYANEFPPHIARDIYKKYNMDRNSKILDPCGGWGGRMLGASVVSDFYYCFEPSTKTFSGLKNLFSWIRKMNPSFTANIFMKPFEDAVIPKDCFDIALTSPPYYDTEKYTDEETNSLNRYKTFDSWCDGFYLPMIQKTLDSLKVGRYFILNIGSRKYPLNKILLSNFSHYEIQRESNFLSGNAGLNKSGEGESFYRIKK